MNSKTKSLLDSMNIERGQTQKNVNKTVLNELMMLYSERDYLSLLDLPCGKKEFLTYVKSLFPTFKLSGADIAEGKVPEYINFYKTDLSRDFDVFKDQKFDIITSVSGIMMFGNTQRFIENCTQRLNAGGYFIITNDNPATIKDRLCYLFFGKFRQFPQVFEDNESMTQIVLIQDLVRLLRNSEIEIEKIIYTSSYLKDLILLPFALLAYPLQYLSLSRRKSGLPKSLIFSMYPFKQMFCTHYIIVGKKK